MPRIVKLTCETATCENNGIAIELETDATAYVCGGCMVHISKVEEFNGSTETAE
jgi:hypothetical protein